MSKEHVVQTITTDIEGQDSYESELFSPSIFWNSALRNDAEAKTNSNISGAPSSNSSRKSTDRKMKFNNNRQGILFNKNILKQKGSKFKPEEIKVHMKEVT